jgi:hypothetical protein
MAEFHTIHLGNEQCIYPRHIDRGKGDEIVYFNHPHPTVTTFSIPTSWSVADAELHIRRQLRHHFAEGTAPSWVEGSHPELVEAIRSTHGVGGRPEEDV